MKAYEINNKVNSIQSTQDMSEILRIFGYGSAFECRQLMPSHGSAVPE
jgi:hypothetical protein